MTRVPEVWSLGYHVSDNVYRYRAIYEAVWPYVRQSVHRLVRENPADLIVSVHPLINAPALRAIRGFRQPVPYITVVTDLVSTHVAWFDKRADLVIVPTEVARTKALKLGLHNDKVQVVGLPVADRFCQEPADRSEIRARLDWPQDVPVLLLVGGGEGMGPLERVAEAIDQAELPAAMVIICGRNRQLQQRLEKRRWNLPVKCYGFVENMPDFMQAADVLVSKAGPGTISEAFIANLPIVLYSRLPGQDEGNVTYVVEQGAGAWAPEPAQVVSVLRRWLSNPDQLRRVSAASQRLARPRAARRIARIIAEKAGLVAPES
jgi:1,2-diacylglycerol 3-beta-galactosyltransferase